MINFGSSWKNHIFIRLVATFLIVIIPLYIIGFNIYNWAIGTLREQTNDSMKAQIDFYLGGLDAEIQRIKLLQYDCVNDESLNQLAFGSELLDDYGRAYNIRQLQQRLYTIKNSSHYIKDVIAEIPSLGIFISALNGMNTLSGSSIKENGKAYVVPISQLSYSGEEIFLNLEFPFQNNNNNDTNLPWFSLKVMLSKEALREALTQFNTINESFSIMLSPSGDDFYISGYDIEYNKELQTNLINKSRQIGRGMYSEFINGNHYQVICSTSDYLEVTLARYIPDEIIYERLKSYQIWFWILSGFSLVIIVYYSASIYKSIHKPLTKLVKAFQAVEKGVLKINVKHKRDDEFQYLYQRFNSMVEKLDLLIDQVYKQKILIQHAELKQLQSQINPHFLYNTFFMLYSIAEADDNDSVKYFLLQLGNYFQFITRNTSDEVPLCKEVEHARTYTDIQVMRFSNRINAEFQELPLEFRNIMVPRLILQPVIENTFKHGLEDKMKNGLMQVSFHKESNILRITVDDNGESLNTGELDKMRLKFSDEYTGEVTALVNIHRRVRLKYGLESGISLSISELGGLKVCINIAVEEEKYVQAIDC